MKILMIADPLLPIPPQGYGGAERIIDLLCRGLHERGHQVRLIAAAHSSTTAEIVIHPAQSINYRWFRWRRIAGVGSFAATLARSLKDVDVVHSHKAIPHWWPLQALVRQPLVITFHNPIIRRHVESLLRIRRRKLCLCGISRAHIKDAPQGPWTVVYNAADADIYPYSEKARRPPYLLYVGRVSALKGTHVAIEVARRCGIDLTIAGNVSKEPGGPEYFRDKIVPRLNDRIRWIGEVTDEQKRELYGGASALLFPIDWSEPFGLVMIESMLCGTPVIAFSRGAVPEIIEGGRTGYVVNTVEEMVAAVRRLEQISRDTCAQTARERFSASVMVDQYVQIYKKLIADANWDPQRAAYLSRLRLEE